MATVETTVRDTWAAIARSRKAAGDTAGAARAKTAVAAYRASYQVTHATSYADGSPRGKYTCSMWGHGKVGRKSTECPKCVAELATRTAAWAAASQAAAA